MKYVQISGNKLIHNDEKLCLRGLGVGGWLNMEHYMFGLPGLDTMIRSELERRMAGTVEGFRFSFFTEQDAILLRSLGINFIRIPFAHNMIINDQTGEVCPEGVKIFQHIKTICDKTHLYYMPDLHTTPGGQNPDWHSGSSTGKALFWEYDVLRDRAVKVWKVVADVLKDSKYLLGYDLLNEPVTEEDQKLLLNQFHYNAAKAIRSIDSKHIILVEGSRFAMDFSNIELPDTNSMYTYHFYPTCWDEQLYSPNMNNEERTQRYRNAHNEILYSMKSYNGPLLCGETGCEISTAGENFAMKLLRLSVDIFEEKHAGWCLWAYKDIGIMGFAYPALDSVWQKLADSLAIDWNHHKDMELGTTLADQITHKWLNRKLSSNDIYRLQFRLRAMMFEPEVHHLLRPALMQLSDNEMIALRTDFRIDRCIIRECYKKLFEEIKIDFPISASNVLKNDKIEL